MTRQTTAPIHDRDQRGPQPPDGQQTWAASRAQVKIEEKELMAQFFADHDFLMPEGADPARDARETAVSIFINQGTSPNVVCQQALYWILHNAAKGPFHITWYTIGTLLFATLHEFRKDKPNFSAATHVHLFPGTVDLQLQAQIGKEAQDYARRIKRRFSYMILGGHSFDLRTGGIGFHFDREIPVQTTCALLKARQKFLFFDSSKFTGEGEVGYTLRDLLSTGEGAVIYTVSSPRSAQIKEAFEVLASDLLTDQPTSDVKEEKSLRLTMVGHDNHSTESLSWRGFLREGSPANAEDAAAMHGELKGAR